MQHPMVVNQSPFPALAAAAYLAACGGTGAEAGAREPVRPETMPQLACEVEARAALPAAVAETSGLARSGRDDDLFWTHNDRGNEPVIFEIDAAGRLIRSVRITGMTMIDWEDLEPAPCDEGTCLYIGDIGDNDGDRDRITAYRVVEPRSDATEAAPAEVLHARFPDGARDAEALFADGSGSLYIVNKGDHEDIALYRWPAPDHAGETVTLERVRVLFPQPADGGDRVTAATATPDGRWVGIRTYRALYLYRTAALLGNAPLQPHVADLSDLAEPQGEALILADDGTVWVSTEAAGKGERPHWSRLRCRFPDV